MPRRDSIEDLAAELARLNAEIARHLGRLSETMANQREILNELKRARRGGQSEGTGETEDEPPEAPKSE